MVIPKMLGRICRVRKIGFLARMSRVIRKPYIKQKPDYFNLNISLEQTEKLEKLRVLGREQSSYGFVYDFE